MGSYREFRSNLLLTTGLVLPDRDNPALANPSDWKKEIEAWNPLIDIPTHPFPSVANPNSQAANACYYELDAHGTVVSVQKQNSPHPSQSRGVRGMSGTEIINWRDKVDKEFQTANLIAEDILGVLAMIDSEVLLGEDGGLEREDSGSGASRAGL